MERDTRQNTRDIAALTVTVTRLATMVEGSEKRHDEDRSSMREVFGGLKSLNEKIGNVAGLQEKVTELTAQTVGLRGDVKNLNDKLEEFPLLKKTVSDGEKKIVEHEGRIDTLEVWKNKHDGATGAAKVFIHVIWAVFGSGITALGFYVLNDYFHSDTPYRSTTTHEVISGE